MKRGNWIMATAAVALGLSVGAFAQDQRWSNNQNRDGAVYTDHMEKWLAFLGHPLRDAWGHAIKVRCPGPVHTKGWDVWSCGANGVDEQGQGDDILVGEDVAEVGSGG